MRILFGLAAIALTYAASVGSVSAAQEGPCAQMKGEEHAACMQEHAKGHDMHAKGQSGEMKGVGAQGKGKGAEMGHDDHAQHGDHAGHEQAKGAKK